MSYVPNDALDWWMTRHAVTHEQVYRWSLPIFVRRGLGWFWRKR